MASVLRSSKVKRWVGWERADQAKQPLDVPLYACISPQKDRLFLTTRTWRGWKGRICDRYVAGCRWCFRTPLPRSIRVLALAPWLPSRCTSLTWVRAERFGRKQLNYWVLSVYVQST